jgi:hypothetical protein
MTFITQGKTNWKFLLIVVILAVIAIGGILWWQNYETQKPIACTQEAKICPDGSAVGRTGPNCEFTACPAPETTDTSTSSIQDWQTYRNEEYGFETKYPDDWKISSGNKDRIVFGNPLEGTQVFSMSISVNQNIKGFGSKQYVEQMLSEANQEYKGNEDKMPKPYMLSYDEKRELIIAGLPAYELFGVFLYDESAEDIYLAKDNYIFQFTFPIAEENPNLSNPIENNKIAHQILSTFRFVEESKIIVNGKTVADVKDFPEEIKIDPKITWELNNIKINNYSVSPNGEWIFISTTLSGVHEVGWLYNIKTKIFSAVVFAFEGGVGEGYWRNDSAFVAFQTAGPKPSTDIKIIYIGNINEYAESNGFYISRIMKNSEIIPHITGWNQENLCFKLYDTEKSYCINPETKKYEEF